MTAKKRAGIADFKAHLSEYLKAVRGGQEITVVDRNQPVATVIPYRATGVLVVREPSAAYRTLGAVPLPPPLKLKVDAVDLLLEDRASE